MNPLSFISTSSSVGRADFAPTPGVRRGTTEAAEHRPAARETDQLELSDRFKRTFDDAPTTESAEPIRHELVSRIREQIASGTYETPDKLVIAAHEALKDIDLTA